MTRARPQAAMTLAKRGGMLLGLGALIASGFAFSSNPGPAGADPVGATAVTAPHGITVFPERDFISATGYTADSLVDVSVWRDGTEIGRAANVLADETGTIEVNHPGGACWGIDAGTGAHLDSFVTPDIKPGDKVYVTDHTVGGDVSDFATTADVIVTQPANVFGAGNVIEMHGTAGTPANPLPIGDLEARLVSPGDLFELTGARTLRAGPGSEGTLSYDAPGSNQWTATWTGLTDADVDRAIAAESRGIWIGPAPASELTIFEISSLVAPGPAAPCTAPLQAPIATPSPTSVDFPATAVDTAPSVAKTVTITNTGNGALSNLDITAVTLNDGELVPQFAVDAAACLAATLAVGESCVINVQFTPHAPAGLKVGAIDILSNAGNTVVVLSASGLGTDGSGTTPFGRPAPALLDFGIRSIGSPAPSQTTTIKNLGDAPLEITGFTIGGTGAADFSVVPGSNCLAGPIAPDAECTATFGFTPGAAGLREATVAFGPGSALTLNGQGLQEAGVVELPGSGLALGVFAARDFVSVEGYVPGELVDIQIIRSGVVVGVATNVAAAADGIAEVNHPGGSCWGTDGTTGAHISPFVTPDIRAGDIVRVLRKEGEHAGEYSQTVTADVFNSHATVLTAPTPGNADGVVVMHGYARTAQGGQIPLGQLESRIIGTSRDPFDLTGKRSIRTGTEGTLTYDSPTSTSWTATYPGLTQHDVDLAVGDTDSRILWLGRDPIALFEITFWEDNPANIAPGPSSPCTAPAENPTPGISLSPNPITFGTTSTVSSGTTRTLTITNTGTADLSVSNIESVATAPGDTPGDFTVVTALPITVAPQTSQQVTVRFLPLPGGVARATTIRVTDNAVGTPHSVRATGLATDTAVPAYFVSQDVYLFPSTDVGDTATSPAFTVFNEGTSDLILDSIVINGANAGDYVINATETTCVVGGPIAPEASCDIVADFVPTNIGIRTATIHITTNEDAPGNVHDIALSGPVNKIQGYNDPPADGVLIEAFSVRDFVVASGLTPGYHAVIELMRSDGLGGFDPVSSTLAAGGSPILVPGDGIVEVNHVGGTCWDTLTPDIHAGDIVRLTQYENVDLTGDEIRDQTHVQDIEVTLPATELVPGSNVITVQGEVNDIFGTALQAGSFEVRIVGAQDFSNGGRSIRTGAEGTVTVSGSTVTATFPLSAADAAIAKAAISSGISWLGRNPVALNEGTMTEWGELPGPTAGCPGVTESPIVTANAAPISLGSSGVGTTSGASTVVFTNNGPGSVTFTGGPVAKGPNAADFAVGSTTCGLTLVSGASCNVSVTFTPSALGSRWASISIPHNGADLHTTGVVTGVGVAAPTLDVLPPPASGAVGATVHLTGTNLASTGALSLSTAGPFGPITVPLTQFTVLSDTAVDFVVPSGTLAAPYLVILVTQGGVATTPFTVIDPLPTVTSVLSGGVGQGLAGASVTITGTNFVNVQSVRFGTVNATFTVDSATSITAVIPVAAPAGNLQVSVVTVAGTASRSFTVLASPRITSFAPVSARTGTRITINGTGFANLQSVSFAGTAGGNPTVNGAGTAITVTVPNNARQGAVTVTVLGGGTASSNGFTIQASPVVTSFAPTSAPVGATVTVTGFNMLTVDRIQVNGRSATGVTVVNANTVTFVVGNGTTTGRVQVSNQWGSGTSAGNLTIIQRPTATAINPTNGTRAQQITVTGSNFTSVTTVEFGAFTLTNSNGAAPGAGQFQIVSATSIRLIPPGLPAAIPAGNYAIRITNPAGAVSAPAYRVN